MVKSASPTFIFWPSWTCSSFTTPETGDGTSMVAFSVSSSRRGSSLATVSPTLTRIFVRSPESTFSPSSGSLIVVVTDSVLVNSYRFVDMLSQMEIQSEQQIPRLRPAAALCAATGRNARDYARDDKWDAGLRLGISQSQVVFRKL